VLQSSTLFHFVEWFCVPLLEKVTKSVGNNTWGGSMRSMNFAFIVENRICVKPNPVILKVLPYCTCVFPQYCHCLKHIWKFCFVMAVSPAVEFLVIKQNSGLFSPIFESHNGPEVTQRARAGEYGGWMSVGIPFFTKE